jgi:hypothetical protein
LNTSSIWKLRINLKEKKRGPSVEHLDPSDRAVHHRRVEDEGQGGAYQRFIAPTSATVRFAKALNRSLTGSMTDMTEHAAFWLAEGDLSPFETGTWLKEIPMTALKHDGSTHGVPRGAFKPLFERC